MYVIEYGQKRKAKKVKCKYCRKSFLCYIKRTRQYCSHDCSYKDRSNKESNVNCAHCGKGFYRNQSKQKNSKSGLFFCDKECKCEAQRIGGIKEIMPAHYGTGFGRFSYRDKFTENELVCGRCGYDEFSCGIDIHHKDKNRENNSKENLIPLCSCCHRGLHNNRWSLDEL